MFFSIVKMLNRAGGAGGPPFYIHICYIDPFSENFLFFIFFLRQSMSA